jgi:hypothetical protein
MEIVQSLLAKMGIFHKPQIKALTTLFAMILIACGKVNFTNLSRYSEQTQRTYRPHDHLLDTFISTLGLSPTVIKSHPNYQNLRSYGVIAA